MRKCFSRNWEEIERGNVFLYYVNRLYGKSLVLCGEDDGFVLWECKIRSDIEYLRQDDASIAWWESDDLIYALIFEEKVTRDGFWKEICNVSNRWRQHMFFRFFLLQFSFLFIPIRIHND